MKPQKKPTTSQLALSVRQPFAELILRGVKTIEFRGQPTNVRGKIYIYASLGRGSKSDEKSLAAATGISIADLDELPRGVVVGTVELHDCTPMPWQRGYEWHLRNPKRLGRPRKPTRRPNPVWFWPW
jgi:hypothetical protein